MPKAGFANTSSTWGCFKNNDSFPETNYDSPEEPQLGFMLVSLLSVIVTVIGLIPIYLDVTVLEL